nr:laccase-12-like [Ipomoea batatas]
MEAFSHNIAKSLYPSLFIGLLVLYANAFPLVNVEVHKHQFVDINVSCETDSSNTSEEAVQYPYHNTITVNGQFPGPTTLEVNNGDTLEIKIINKAQYNVTIHCSWLRATVYGALIIHRRAGESHQFPKPLQEKHPLYLKTGAAANVPNAFTINGQPGDMYKCSSQGTLTYWLRCRPEAVGGRRHGQTALQWASGGRRHGCAVAIGKRKGQRSYRSHLSG